MRNKFYNRVVAAAVAATLLVGTLFTGGAQTLRAAEQEKTAFPWSLTTGETTEDYIADSYEGVEADHVLESVTQERLLDILSSKGTYYILFSGPEHETGKKAVPVIHAQAKKDGIRKIYHFDPYIDGYQIDITDEETSWKGSKGTVYELWTRITELLPDEEVIRNYRSEDTLLLAVTNDGATKKISRSWNLAADSEFLENTAKEEIAKVFQKEAGSIQKGDIRTDFQFFQRVYNGAADFVETRQGEEATPDRLGKHTEIFSETDKEDFPLHQVNFNELIHLLNTKGEHIIFFGGSWCHNTQAIIGSVARKAKANGKKVYVYDTVLGNQLTFGKGNEIDQVTGNSSAFNSRNNVVTEGEKAGNSNISYLYGELVKYLGDFVTENNSNQNNSISYFPNGVISGSATSVKPWESGEEGIVKNAIRLQLPFLIAYNKEAAKPVTRQWLHKNKAGDGTYTEYMLELSWVLNTKEAAEDKETNPKARDGLTKTEFAAEAVKELSTVLGDKEPAVSEEPKKDPEKQEPQKQGNEPTQKKENNQTEKKQEVKAPAKAKIRKVSAKKKAAKKVIVTVLKVKGADGYEAQVYKAKKIAKKNLLAEKSSKKTTLTLTSKKLKNRKALYVRARAYKKNGTTKVYGKWSAVKKIKSKK